MTEAPVKNNPITPQFAATIFFAIFALMFFIFAKYTLLSIDLSIQLPLLPFIIAMMITGALIGKCFGKTLAKETAWYKLFFLGVLIAIITLLLFSMAIFLRAYFKSSSEVNFFTHYHQWREYFIFFGVLVIWITSTIGLWLMPLTGLAAIYFNKRFLPGLLAFDKLEKQTHDASND